MRKILLTIVCVIGLLENNSYARIGETLAQCEERYGSPITKEGLIREYLLWMVSPAPRDAIGKNGEVNLFGEIYYFFNTGDYIICCKLYEGKIEAIRFMKNESWDRKPVKLSDTEINILLSANKSDGEWIKDRYLDRWSSPKFERKAFIDNNVLKINTREYTDRIEMKQKWNKEKKSEQEKTALDKF